MAENITFSDLVREAFIDPLRSVLIVDDEYPTWEEILNSQLSADIQDTALQDRSALKRWRNVPKDPLEIIKEFRDRKPGFVIDIHDPIVQPDGQTETASELADHLHQSDLLVLDYNLEGNSGGLGGTKAREILKSILTNNHFNLIILHTGEDDLDEVMADCLISLMHSCTSKFDEKLIADLKNLDEKLDELEADGEFDRERFRDCFTIDDYLETRRTNQTDFVRDYMGRRSRLSGLLELGENIGLKGGELKTFLFWAIREFEKAKADTFSKDVVPDGLLWKKEQQSKWMRTTKGFVSFVKKGPKDLLTELRKALEDWKPTPSRLLSSKFRHVLNSVGVEAEDRALLKKYVFAYFYKRMCEPAREGVSEPQAQLSRAFRLKGHVSRQSEAISFLIEDEIVEFGKKIIDVDAATGNSFATHYGINLSDRVEEKKAVARYNHYVSTLPQKKGDDQLDSGHIFKLENNWWVCATPACDLQPGQTSIAFVGASNELRPFTALKLVEIKSEEVGVEHINSGSYCFVEDKGKIITLGLRSLKDEAKPSTQKVTWRTFVAKEGGLISDGSFTIFQLKLDVNRIDTPEATATVVAKLRYEYALNYIQRVGSSVSRIGLDYAAYSENTTDDA